MSSRYFCICLIWCTGSPSLNIEGSIKLKLAAFRADRILFEKMYMVNFFNMKELTPLFPC
jgi:hypothetical protein